MICLSVSCWPPGSTSSGLKVPYIIFDLRNNMLTLTKLLNIHEVIPKCNLPFCTWLASRIKVPDFNWHKKWNLIIKGYIKSTKILLLPSKCVIFFLKCYLCYCYLCELPFLFLRLTKGTLPSHVLLDTGGSDARVFNLKVIIIQGSLIF